MASFTSRTSVSLVAGCGQCVAVALLEQLVAQREDAVADVPLGAVVDALLYEIGQPALQLRSEVICSTSASALLVSTDAVSNSML